MAAAKPPHLPAPQPDNTELRVLPTNADGRSYQLHALPGVLPQGQEPLATVFPFVTDGYWDLATMVVFYNNQVYDKVLPEMIIGPGLRRPEP